MVDQEENNHLGNYCTRIKKKVKYIQNASSSLLYFRSVHYICLYSYRYHDEAEINVQCFVFYFENISLFLFWTLLHFLLVVRRKIIIFTFTYSQVRCECLFIFIPWMRNVTKTNIHSGRSPRSWWRRVCGSNALRGSQWTVLLSPS